MSFIEELKRRNVFRVGIAYVVASWLLMQATDLVFPRIGLEDSAVTLVFALLGIGFIPALIFAWAFELTPDGIKKEKDVDRSQSITQVTGRKLDFTIIGILVLALGYFAYDKFVLDPARDAQLLESSGAAQNIEPTAESTEKSIAVLPFVNMSSDPEQEYFSDGISEEILNALAKVKELQVSGRTSSFAFKGQTQDLRLIGESLGVDHILEGSVRKSGNTVRITAQLIRVDNGFHLWSETYDRELDNIFAIQDEISTNILQQLKATLLEGEEETVTAKRTNSQAYDLYLLAKQRMYERTGPTIESAADLLDQAIAIDSEYAPAYALRGIATLLLADRIGTYGDIPLDQARAQSKLYIDQSLELDPELAEGWAGLGLYYYIDIDPSGVDPAIEALEKALSINPGLIDASNWLHNSLMQKGRPMEARQVVMGMIERDPLYRPGIRNAVGKFTDAGEQDKAQAFIDRIRPLIPNDATIKASEAGIQASLGNLARALNLAEEALALQPSNSVNHQMVGIGLLRTHQYEKASEWDVDWVRANALTYLGRQEEASILAFKLADEQADIETLFWFLNFNNRSEEVIAYLTERWEDLDSLQESFPAYGGDGYSIMLAVALAYSRAGNQPVFDDALKRIRSVHDALTEQSIANSYFFLNESRYHALAGELDSSLEFMDRAISGGLITHNPMAQEYPALQPLEGDPRFEALQTRMIEHLNRERAQLNLEPVSL